ncbi:ester cyclase [Roseobacteraceae bacterium S113]
MILSRIQHSKRALAAILAISAAVAGPPALADSSSPTTTTENCTREQEAHNKALIARFVSEGQNGRNLVVVRQYLSGDFTDHSGAQDPTRDGSIAFHQALFTAFPDFQVVIHQQVAECDRVVTHKTFSGTHVGDIFGFPPTNVRMEFDVIDILRIQDDQVVDHWVVNNMMEKLITQSAQAN